LVTFLDKQKSDKQTLPGNYPIFIHQKKEILSLTQEKAKNIKTGTPSGNNRSSPQ
jgi:hypothetical protein